MAIYEIKRANIFGSTRPKPIDNGSGVEFPERCTDCAGFREVWARCMGPRVKHTDVMDSLVGQAFEAETVPAAKVTARAMLAQALVEGGASTIVPSASSPFYNPISGGGHSTVSGLNTLGTGAEEAMSFEFEGTKAYVYAFLTFEDAPAAGSTAS